MKEGPLCAIGVTMPCDLENIEKKVFKSNLVTKQTEPDLLIFWNI